MTEKLCSTRGNFVSECPVCQKRAFERRTKRIEAAARAALSGLVASRYNRDHTDGDLSLNGLAIRMGELFVNRFDEWKRLEEKKQ